MAVNDKILLIYGANGFTGALTARRAVGWGMRPVLGGRDGRAVGALAAELGLESRTAPLTDPGALDGMLEGVDVLLNCVGPPTVVPPLVQAALRTGTHYLDIAGDCEYVYSLDRHAEAARVALCPMAGYDLVPNDVLAVRLKELLPDATHVDVGVLAGGASQGSSETVLVLLRDKGTQVREDGLLRMVPFGSRRLSFDGPDGRHDGYLFPFPDPYTLWRSTGIPNIAAYVSSAELSAATVRVTRWVEPRLTNRTVFRLARWGARRRPSVNRTGEPADQRSLVWARVRNGRGGTVEGWIETPPGYGSTAALSLLCARRLLTGNHPVGACTPASLVDLDAVLGLPGFRGSANLAPPGRSGRGSGSEWSRGVIGVVATPDGD
ncbi:MAG: hypothetical protein QOE80_4566 [Actinomycetota bacterium]|jgi:short subunit dehydrogenase-like uncharacterized protein|nr:hypothetical protein [Actinomycetota bacterium]